MKAPFPWFGGKSRAAHLIWQRFGDVANYVEPFAGSLAVLLGRPHEPHTETVNDRDCYVVNFWRAVKTDPDAVAEWASDPPNEADLVARNNWLVKIRDTIQEQCFADPDFCSPKVAGWWAWVVSWWIGSKFAERPVKTKLPALGGKQRGIQNPNVNLAALSQRLAKVRIACGAWARICTPGITHKLGVTGVLLDPPYADTDVYPEANAISAAVGEWARENGDNPKLRIAVCGYDGEHRMPSNWHCEAWKATGGYGNRAHGTGRQNSHRERIWFSPHCLQGIGGHLCCQVH